MSVEQNLQLFNQMVDALNKQDLDALDRYYAKDMIYHGPAGQGNFYGLEAYKNDLLAPFYTSFPDYHTEHDILMADGDWIASRGIVTGTQRGEWLGLPPTGKHVQIIYSDFWVVRNGVLAELWTMIDTLDALNQLGLDFLKKISCPGSN